MKTLPDTLDLIAARLDQLEHRVEALERSRPEPAQTPPASLPAEAAAASWPEPQPEFTSAFPVLGSSLLGIAGAYLLRAISGAGLLSRGVVALIAAIYAGAWLYAAARAALRRKLAGALFAAVSILILAPMLWEMTVRFNAMRGTTAALILALYVAGATVLALRSQSDIVFSVTFAGSALAAAALSIATHQMAEFTFLLLAMLIVCDWAQRKLDAPGIRLLVALAADAGVWTLLLIYRLAPSERADYPAVSAALILLAPLLLLAVEVFTVGRSIFARNQPVPIFAAIQAMIAFALAATAIVWLAPAIALPTLGSVCLILSAACYAAAYGPARHAEQPRNFRILCVWAPCLLLGAAFTLVQSPAASIALGIACLAAVLVARRLTSRTLELQGVLFLLVAAAASGLAAWAVRALAGDLPTNPGAPSLVVAACALLAYAAAREHSGEEWRNQALHLFPTLLAAFAVGALLVIVLVDVARPFLAPQAFHLALMRTIALCALAVALAWGGARLSRPAMVRAAYAALALVTAKLLFEDLRHGHLEFTAGSIIAVALTLIAVPRLTRTRPASPTS